MYLSYKDLMLMSKKSKVEPISVPDISIPALELAKSESDAEKRAERWRCTDPFPKIEAALLNSADILAYVKATSLIYPFDVECLKGASYDVPISGEVVYYDSNNPHANKKVIVNLENDGDYFDLLPNAIAFVTLSPSFRMPYYLALRFNLKITHIYKGLLLGTGPLVDPGFVGKLSIPLHNLTNNTYRFHKGDLLITMEFTKMSSNKLWNRSPGYLGHNENYIINDIKSNRTVLEYISKALKKDGLNQIISSIPEAMVNSEKNAESAKRAAKKAERSSKFQTAVSVIAVCTLVISAVTMSIDSINKANERYDNLRAEFSNLKSEYADRIDELSAQLKYLESLLGSEFDQDKSLDTDNQYIDDGVG